MFEEGICGMSDAPTTPSAVPKSPAPQLPSASPETLDQITETTKPRGWWALWITLGAIAMVLLWSILGNIPQQVSGIGTVSALAHSRIITTPISGTVTLPVPVEGRKGDDSIIATVTPFDGSSPVNLLAGEIGQVTEFFVEEGVGVEVGESIATLVTLVDRSSPITVVTFLPASIASVMNEGATVQLTVSNVATGVTTNLDAIVTQVSESASSLASMVAESGSEELSEQWFTDSGGLPYRVELTASKWPAKGSTIPIPGEVIEMTNTYAYVHPIELLFGGNE